MKNTPPLNSKTIREEQNYAPTNTTTPFSGSGSYEIIVEGQLDEHWEEWLGGLEIAHDRNGFSVLGGIIPDQSALHGILAQIHNLGIALVSLKRVEDEMASKGRHENG